MDWAFLWLAAGIAIAGYCIGDGLKNFKNPDAKNLIEKLDDDDEGYELIKENQVHYFLGISKEDVRALIKEYPDIPHITINQNVYFQKAKLKQWLSKMEERQ